MTPESLAVERDRLLEGGRTPEEVERMQRAADPQYERDLCTRTAIRVRGAAERLVAEIQGDALDSVSMQAVGWLRDTRNRIDAMDVTPHLPPFSPPETATGVSVLRPEAPAVEIPNRRCPKCGVQIPSDWSICNGCW